MNSQISPFETLHVNSKKISCNGGSTALGHPLVYLNMGKNDYVICPYCSKYFTIKSKAKPSSPKPKNKIKK
jgi:uncharacterized Zn-finger protein